MTFPSSSGFYTIELLGGESVDGILFGNYSDSLDFGDLPEPLDSLLPCPSGQCYPTLLPMGAGRKGGSGAALAALSFWVFWGYHFGILSIS